LKLVGLLTGKARAVAKRASRKRADLLLIDRALAESREQAQTLIMEGLVFTPSGRVPKASSLFPETVILEVRGRLPYVGRGGLKLAHALDFFAFPVRDLVALDIGASTGGFTDCLLQRGASGVYSLDVGHGQLDYRLRADPRVAVMEKRNARHPFPLPEPVDLVTVDVSFISLALVIPAALEHLKDGRFLVVLVKPQFEARKEEVGRGGVIKDPQVHANVLGRTIAWAVGYGLRVRNLCSSPILGDAGNREFFLLLQKSDARALEKAL
jgi:23S rRNA (cytidine1920-2'-O)/16S rRNA (cytidine1409-2'-O)-methyltransferase